MATFYIFAFNTGCGWCRGGNPGLAVGSF